MITNINQFKKTYDGVIKRTDKHLVQQENISITIDTHFINENKIISYIDEDKLLDVAKSIDILCNGEYGDTYWHKEKNKIFICVGDSNPFDIESLEYYIKDNISDYKNHDNVSVEVDMECGPGEEEGWFKYNIRKQKFEEYK